MIRYFDVLLLIVVSSGFYLLLYFDIFFDESLIFGGSDGIEILYPAFLSGFEIWSESLYGGIPVYADPHSAVFNIFYFPLKLFFGPEVGYDFFYLCVWLSLGVASRAACMILCGNRFFSFIAGLWPIGSVFVFSQINHVYMVFGGVSFFCLLGAVESLLRDQRREALILAVIGVGIVPWGTHPQLIFYSVYFSAFYLILRLVSTRFHGWTSSLGLFGIVVVVVVVSISALQTMPMTLMALESTRNGGGLKMLDHMSLPIRSIGFYLNPFLHGPLYSLGIDRFGITSDNESMGYFSSFGWLLGFISVVCGKSIRVKSISVSLMICALMSCVISLGHSTLLPHVLQYIPGYDSFRAVARHLFFYEACLVLMSCVGLSTLWNMSVGVSSVKKLTIVWTVLVLLSLVGIYTSFESYQFFAREELRVPEFSLWIDVVVCHALSVACGCILLCIFSSLKWKRAYIFLILSFTIFDTWSYRFLVFPVGNSVAGQSSFGDHDFSGVDLKKILNESGYRYMPGDSGNLLLSPNTARVEGINAMSGHHAFIFADIAELLRFSTKGYPAKDVFLDSRSELDLYSIKLVSFRVEGGDLASVFGKYEFLESPRWKYVTTMKVFVSRKHNVFREYAVFENLRVAPRVRVGVQRILPFDESIDMIHFMHGRENYDSAPYDVFKPYSDLLVLNNDFERFSRARGQATILETGFTDTSAFVNVESKGASVLMIAEPHTIFRKVLINGIEVDSFLINGGLTGVIVEDGYSNVQIVPRWSIFLVSVAITLAGLLCFVLLLIHLSVKRPG